MKPNSKFKIPSLGFTLLCVFLIALTLSLGYWQHLRAMQKDAWQKLADERLVAPTVALEKLINEKQEDLIWTRTIVKGTYDTEASFLLDNRSNNGQPGYHVISPLEFDNGLWLLVNRGWMPVAQIRSQVKAPPPPTGQVEVIGVLVEDSKNAFELGEDTGQHNLWQKLKITDWQSRTGRESLSVVLLADKSTTDLVPVTAHPDFLADRSRGYRLQWLLLALVAFFGWLAIGFGDIKKKT